MTAKNRSTLETPGPKYSIPSKAIEGPSVRFYFYRSILSQISIDNGRVMFSQDQEPIHRKLL
jgi:hypothetical protein